MQLILDIGNSSIKFAIFNGDDLIELGYIKNESSTLEIAELLTKHVHINKAIVSSVRENPPFISFVKEKIATLELNHTTPLPIRISYKSPETLGRDRIAAAVAASAFFGNPVLSIDAGTCITFDFINENGEYIGGAISPGINMRLKAMHTFTGRLPYIKFEDFAEPLPLIGQNTKECLLTGAINGCVFEIDQTIHYYKEQYPALKVVICGGDASFLAKAVKNSIFADPLLVLKGLNIILQFNVPEK
ncbi:MAG: type III pantothenate kinase [Bacteroidia bacterium]